MANPSVLILGAGALGTVTGYHLSLAGADATFLVRPNRMRALQSPQLLYCHDDGELKEFADYRAVDSVTDAAARRYDFVLITLDGATCCGEEATALLESLGDAIRETSAVVLVCGIGVYDYIREVMRFPGDRVIEGSMSILSYQTDRVTLPAQPSPDPDKLSRASMAYTHTGKKSGFMVADRPEEPARAFAELYNRCGVSHCSVLNSTLYRMFTASIFPVLAAFHLAGWPDADTMAGNKELMALAARAMAETMALPQHGWRGKLGALMINRFTLARMNKSMERNALPVDYSAFNRFHHGGKVREQDMDVMRQCAESGRAQGKAMPALNELLRRYEAHLDS